MNEISESKKKLRYQICIEIWEQFCILHKDLFDLTAQEYLKLLGGEIEELESITSLKEQIIQEIGKIEQNRYELINEINDETPEEKKILKAADLILYFSTLDQEKNISALRNLNQLLIEIIQKLQDQNKKNQIFLNKAMISIKDLKDSFTGKKVFKTYGADGLTKNISR